MCLTIILKQVKTQKVQKYLAQKSKQNNFKFCFSVS